MVGIQLDISQPERWTILGMDLGFKEQGDDLGPDMVPSFTVRGMSPVFLQQLLHNQSQLKTSEFQSTG